HHQRSKPDSREKAALIAIFTQLGESSSRSLWATFGGRTVWQKRNAASANPVPHDCKTSSIGATGRHLAADATRRITCVCSVGTAPRTSRWPPFSSFGFLR